MWIDIDKDIKVCLLPGFGREMSTAGESCLSMKDLKYTRMMRRCIAETFICRCPLSHHDLTGRGIPA